MAIKAKAKVTEVDKGIGQKLRAARKSQGMSQEDLAVHLDITFQQIQKYEKGVNRVSASRLFEICNVFNLSPTHFLDNDVSNNNVYFTNREDFAKLAYEASFLTPEQVTALRQFIKTFKKDAE